VAKRFYAQRYAQAVFNIALEENQLDSWLSDLEKIAFLGEDAELVGLLQNPKIGFDARAKILSENLKLANPLALNLVYLLLIKGRLGMAGDIAGEYRRLLNRQRGIETADVVTAVPLDDKSLKKLEEKLGTLVGKKVVVKAEVDPAVIGGVTARIGGKLLDGSTRSKLAALKRELAGG
jgi:F-type H+-transporting ATPase subunit delta